MTLCLMVLPNQWFDATWWKRILEKNPAVTICIWEDPIFYGFDQEYKQILKLNKLRLVYQRVGHGLLAKRLDEIFAMGIDAISKHFKDKSLIMYDPCDKEFAKRIIQSNVPCVIEDTPSFITSRDDCIAYYGSKPRIHLYQKPFYMYVKNKIRLLQDVPSQDVNNRVPYPLKPKQEERVKNVYISTSSNKYNNQFREAIEWVQKHNVFKHNYGPLEPNNIVTMVKDHLSRLPLTPKEASNWLELFLVERFKLFGKYEDAIVKDHPNMFHTCISTFLNTGLLTPLSTIQHIIKFGTQYKIAINNIEGLCRQIIGWREFSRLYYMFVDKSVYKKNALNITDHNDQLAQFYNATTGFTIADDAIRNAFDTGYLHHIRRLMVMSNLMTLKNIHPDNVFKWMYEFSLDSWDWVMVFNVYSMGTWSDGGYSMHKPYISSGAYLKRMSRGYADNHFDEWTRLYRTFIEQHRAALQHTPLLLKTSPLFRLMQ